MSVEKKASNLKPRCSLEGCRKKLKLTDLECMCAKRYCQLHRLPEDHRCGIDYGKRDKSILEKRLMSEKTVADKVIKI